ncbi:DUF6318 family protein [Brachybacterium hainanense]|uniref:DUF6318 family protein n=1 Tax=Brachybacterium hainanense TaxID=1541174 RepID=A0ABV6R8S7_9MICO
MIPSLARPAPAGASSARFRRRAVIAAAVAALALSGAACSPKDDPDGPATPTTHAAETSPASDGGGDAEAETPTESEEPSTPSVALPDPADYPKMKEHSDEGAQQAFAFYWANAAVAGQTGDVSTLATLRTDTCEACIRFEDQVADNLATGDLWSSVEVKELDLRSVEESGVEYMVYYEFEFVSAEDAADKGLDGLVYGSAGAMSWHADGWKVDELSYKRSGSDG